MFCMSNEGVCEYMSVEIAKCSFSNKLYRYQTHIYLNLKLLLNLFSLGWIKHLYISPQKYTHNKCI